MLSGDGVWIGLIAGCRFQGSDLSREKMMTQEEAMAEQGREDRIRCNGHNHLRGGQVAPAPDGAESGTGLPQPASSHARAGDGRGPLDRADFVGQSID